MPRIAARPGTRKRATSAVQYGSSRSLKRIGMTVSGPTTSSPRAAAICAAVAARPPSRY
jgi:hypothetical protein